MTDINQTSQNHSLLGRLHQFFNGIGSFFVKNKGTLIRLAMTVVLFGIIIINSGYAVTYLLDDTFIKTLILVICFVIVGGIFAFTCDFKQIIKRFKTVKPTVAFIAVVVFAFSIILTMFASGESFALVSYAAFGLRIVCCYLIAKMFTFKKFVRIFQHVMFAICVLSLIVYLYIQVSGSPFSFIPGFVSQRGETFDNYFFLIFQGDHARMQGPFWEPGLFSSFLLIAMAFEILLNKKVRWLYFIAYSVCLLLTASTFGYLALAIIAIIAINKKVGNFWLSAFLYTLVMGTILTYILFSDQIIPFLAEKLPRVFGKLVAGESSTLVDKSRFLSPYLNIQIWLTNWKTIIWGMGSQSADLAFAAKANELGILAQTSTTTQYLAQYGILGLAFTVFFFWGLFKVRGIEIEDKILLSILFLLIMNKEPHNAIAFEWILMFLWLKEYVDKDDKALAYDAPSKESLIYCFSNNDDSSIVKRNIVLSFLVKGLALALGFFSYKIYMNFFDNDSVLGVWLTVLSIMQMIITLDLGLGNGLKNKMVKALVDGDVQKQKQLISCTYISSFIITGIIIAVATPLIFTLDMNSFLGISSSVVDPLTLRIAVELVACSIAIEFSLKNVTSLLQAKQKQAASSVFPLISTVLLMGFALVFRNKFFDPGKALMAIAIAYVFTINLPLLIGTFPVFIKDYKGLAPSIKYFGKEGVRDVMSLGIGFFVIQLFLLVLNSTNTMLVSNIFGSDQAVIYADYEKPFNIIYSLFAIVTMPYWAMVAKEKVEGHSDRIMKNLKQVLLFFAVFAFLTVALGLLFQPFLDIWLTDKSPITSWPAVLTFALYILEMMLIAAFTAIANGLSIIKPQIILFAIAAVIKIGLCGLMYIIKDVHLEWYYVVAANVIGYIPLIVGLIYVVLKDIKKIKLGGLLNEKAN